MVKILMVDDEKSILEVLQAYFHKEGWSTVLAFNGVEALQKTEEHNPDLILLDLMLPDISGEEVCRLIRKESDVPIIMLTAKSTEDDLINGIIIGADDYIVKPFSPREVVIRVKALLRRVNKSSLLKSLSFNGGELEIDQLKKEVKVNGQVVLLTPNEYKILDTMAKFPGRVYSRVDLLENIQNDGTYFEGYERNIDTHIKNLRKKIERNSSKPELIVTVFGMGYKFGGNTDA